MGQDDLASRTELMYEEHSVGIQNGHISIRKRMYSQHAEKEVIFLIISIGTN